MKRQMMKSLRLFLVMITALIATSCATNNYSNFYTPRISGDFEKTEDCKHYNYTQEYLSQLLGQGYIIIGTSGFEGPLQSVSNAVRHGKSIGADIVLTSSEYTRTDHGSQIIPIYSPGETSSVTTYSSGSANAYGSANMRSYGSGGYAYGSGTSTGSATYSETSTSYYTAPGTTTYVTVPYAIAKYNQQAVYLRSSHP